VPTEEMEKGRIDVIASRENDDIIIDVVDNGIGLPKGARARLLEPYVTTREKGTGLGLAIVGRVLEDHGGRIELKDASDFRPGQRGAWMRLRFAVSGQAAKDDLNKPDRANSGPNKAEVSATIAKEPAAEAKDPAAETKRLEAETIEPVDATNNQAKIKAATGN